MDTSQSSSQMMLHTIRAIQSIPRQHRLGYIRHTQIPRIQVERPIYFSSAFLAGDFFGFLALGFVVFFALVGEDFAFFAVVFLVLALGLAVDFEVFLAFVVFFLVAVAFFTVGSFFLAGALVVAVVFFFKAALAPALTL